VVGDRMWSAYSFVADAKLEDMQNHGFSDRYYQRIEAGDQNLTLITLNRLAKTFGVAVQGL
jgi:hypothetical protein